MHSDWLTWALVGTAAVIVVALLLLLLPRLSPDARIRRRIRKARGRIVSRAPEPSVKFSVKTPKE